MQTTTHNDLQDSGLHNEPFFITKYLSLDNIECDNIEWNIDLHRKYCIDEDDLLDMSEDDIYDIVREDFYNGASIYNYYRQVESYNYSEEDAYKCRLIPFTIYDDNEDKETHFLGFDSCGMHLTPKLDAYFFLQTGKMDPASIYFRQKDYFKDLVPDDIFSAIEDKFGGVIL
jgi:hypothetical protein